MLAYRYRPKVAGRDMPPRNKEKRIRINEGSGLSKGKTTKLPTSSGMGNDKAKENAITWSQLQ